MTGTVLGSTACKLGDALDAAAAARETTLEIHDLELGEVNVEHVRNVCC